MSKIALLHDIGHTPYGHVGERTLHDICSGNIKVDYLPDFKALGCSCGFKHNINSGLLYKEYLIKVNKAITVEDCVIIEGITKHSKLFVKGQKKLDYGFKIINSVVPVDINFKKAIPSSIEGFIVCYADEIAQMFSDYLDLFSGGFDITALNSLKPFSVTQSSDAQQIADGAVNYMIDLFVAAFNPVRISNRMIKKSTFGSELDKFDKARKKIIKSNRTINGHDYLKERNVIVLFQHYFNHPSDGLDLLEDFQHRMYRFPINLSTEQRIRNLSKNKIDRYIKTLVKDASKKRKNKKRKAKLSSRILKVFIRSVAIHISKMTDSYADHKVKKIISSKCID